MTLHKMEGQMSGNLLDNNIASISGKIVSKPSYSHEVYGEGFYIFNMDVKRLSDSFDMLPVLFSERLLQPEQIIEGAYASVEGQFRSYNNFSRSDGHKLMLTVFAREIILYDEEIGRASCRERV